ncbi:chorismate mutase [Prescottella defluvii]|nr:chorismate mutase [Prescottella defluvii]
MADAKVRRDSRDYRAGPADVRRGGAWTTPPAPREPTPPSTRLAPSQPTSRVWSAYAAELDAIDGRLLEDIRARIDVCVRIGEVKRRQRIPMMQPQRVGLVQARAEQFARENGLSRNS